MDTRTLESLNRCGKTTEVLKSVLAMEDLHFFDRCDAIANYKSITGFSERTISQVICKSKSEIHRMMDVSRTDPELRSAVYSHKTDYYVIVRYWQTTSTIQDELRPLILSGEIKKHKQVNSFLLDRRPSQKESLQRKHDLLERQLKKCKMELERAS